MYNITHNATKKSPGCSANDSTQTNAGLKKLSPIPYSQFNPIFRGVAQLVARLLWALSPTAACGGCREGKKVQRSKFVCVACQCINKISGTANRANKRRLQKAFAHTIFTTQFHIPRCSAVGSAPALGLRERVKPLLLKTRLNTGFLAVSNLDFRGLTLYLTTTVELDFSRFL